MLFFYISLIGLFIGSFLNVLIDRLPERKDVFVDRSKCDFCNKPLRWFELIPLFSFLIQGGQCRRCHKQLSFQYPFIELVTGFLFGILAYTLIPDWYLLVASLIIASSLLVIFVIDVKHYLIPDSMIVVGLIGAVLLVLKSPQSIMIHILSGLGAFVFLYAIWFFTKGKGMGFGDVKFAFFMGFALGFPSIIVGLYAAFLTGAILGLILMLGRFKSLKSKIPFGPFLIIGYGIALVFSTSILQMFSFI